ncbi:ABC transporter ATP-binding protein [Christensenellaceae bacterium OttesenSCG-928-K19]|nr:ABC transporter ATP-binding protein [Christensenellaceae bacterium OttesenSCG-928-K19]
MEITFDRVTKRFGTKTAVEDFSARLPAGVHGLLGPNGAGKTTLMRLMAGILATSGGQILLDGQPVGSMGQSYRAQLGYLPQQFGYYPTFTALDFLLYMAAVKGLPKPYARAEAEELLEKVRLGGETNRKIKTFSGGMKQRLGIAQAMQGKPAIMILDEPTAGLDPKERIFFRNMLADYARDKLVLLSTHIVADIESIAGNVIVIKKGKLLLTGAPDDILQAVQGKVWECSLPLREAEDLSARYPVTSFRHQGNEAFVRLVADYSPCDGATQAPPGLEDLYLYYFADEGVESDGITA